MNKLLSTKIQRRKKQTLIGLLLFCGMMLLAFSGNATTTPPVETPELMQNSQSFKKQLSEKWGIEITALRLTAAGRMIDFRYRVLDKDKAAPLHKRQTKPYLIHEKSGKVLAVPNTAKVGALRNSNMPQQDRIYWMFFGNNGFVKQGDKVSIVIGEFKAENLTVE